jgi:hypothetical protein
MTKLNKIEKYIILYYIKNIMNLSDNLSSILNKYVVLFADSLVKHHTQLRTKDICDKLLPQSGTTPNAILQVFKQKKNVLQVKKTLHGNYTVDIPEQYKLVMNVTDKVIVGYENEEGMVSPLTKELTLPKYFLEIS